MNELRKNQNFNFDLLIPPSLPNGTEGSRLMRISLVRISLVRISLLRFFETFHKYSPYASFGLFISLVPFFGQKIAKQSQFDIVSLTWNLLSTNDKILLVLVTFKNSNSFDSDTV